MQNWKGPANLAGAFILAGTSVIAAKILSETLGPFTTGAACLTVALPALLVACRKRIAAHVRSMGRREWLLAFAQAGFGIFLFRLFMVYGLLRTSAAEAGILTGATPAVTALLAGLVLRERVGAARAMGIACTVAGVLALQGMFAPGAGFSASHIAGNLLVLAAALSESAFNILSRAGALRAPSAKSGQDSVSQAAVVVAIALLLGLVPALLEHPAAALLRMDTTGWLALGWYGLVSTGVAYICWYAGIRRSEATVAAAFSGLMPLTAVALSVLLLGERPGVMQLAGGALVAAGMLLSGLAGEKVGQTASRAV
jgi:drug/metabolite transporter (DMT)-like permease